MKVRSNPFNQLRKRLKGYDWEILAVPMNVFGTQLRLACVNSESRIGHAERRQLLRTFPQGVSHLDQEYTHQAPTSISSGGPEAPIPSDKEDREHPEVLPPDRPSVACN